MGVPTVQKRHVDAFPKYKPPKGFISPLARSGPFEYVTLAIISVNAIWIGADTQYNDKDTLEEVHPIFQVGENLFCIYFTAEVVIRFWAFRLKSLCLTDGWFMFDSSLVFIMVLETGRYQHLRTTVCWTWEVAPGLGFYVFSVSCASPGWRD